MTILRVVTLGTRDFPKQYNLIELNDRIILRLLNAQVGKIVAPNANIVVDERSNVGEIEIARHVFEFIPMSEDGNFRSKIGKMKADEIEYIIDSCSSRVNAVYRGVVTQALLVSSSIEKVCLCEGSDVGYVKFNNKNGKVYIDSRSKVGKVFIE
jgi:hypothetical protein